MKPILSALVTRHIHQNLLRSVVTVVAVMLGVALVFAIDVANATAVASFSTSVNVIANHVNLQILGSGRGFDERTLLRVQALSGVQAAYPIVEDELIVGEHTGRPQSGEALHAIGMDVTRPLPQAVDSGGSLDLNTFINHRGVIVSRRIALKYGVRPGDVLPAFAGVHAVDLHVSAVLPTHSAGVDSSVAFVDIATAQDLFAKVGRLDRIDIIADPTRLLAVRAAIARTLPPGVRVIEPSVRTGEINRLLRSFRLNLEALSYVALLVGMYLIYNTLAISVVQRKPEIATLRALGARRGQIFATFLFEGALYGLAGSAVGLIAGALLAQGAVQAVSHTVSTLYVGSHADGAVFTVAAYVKAVVVGVGASMLSAVAPAWEASSVAPAIGMRAGGFETRWSGGVQAFTVIGVVLLFAAWIGSRAPALDGVPVFGYLSAVLTIAGASLCVPAILALSLRALRLLPNRRLPWFSLALRAMRASARRYAVAIASLALAVAMMTSIAILITSFRATIIDWAQQTLQADLFIKPPGAVDASFSGRFTPEFVARIAAVPGVQTVDTFRGFAIPFRGGTTYLGATDFRSVSARSKVSFVSRVDTAKLSQTMPNSLNAIVSEPFAVRYGLHDADRFTLNTPSGVRTFTIAATYNDYSSDSGAFIMDRTTFVRLYHDRTSDSIAVYLQRGAPLPAVRSAIVRAVSPARIDIESNRELRAIVLVIFDRTFAITNALYIVSIVVAILGVVSTLFALVLERRRDIAVLRYLGATVGDIRAMVYTQAAVVGAVGAVWGLLLGFALSLLLIFTINFQSFGWLIALRLPYPFFGQVILLMVGAALLAAIFPSSIAARIRTAEVLRDE
ncbi:MAG: FtsX-like permease family protein [Candidatus Eremiobacteraeota bacterium]|nr:FtsX-like permease family protein [Candidatus Eremiobacteraeota bacterium]